MRKELTTGGGLRERSSKKTPETRTWSACDLRETSWEQCVVLGQRDGTEKHWYMYIEGTRAESCAKVCMWAWDKHLLCLINMCCLVEIDEEGEEAWRQAGLFDAAEGRKLKAAGLHNLCMGAPGMYN
jgi:hypothetical protein